MIKYYFKEIKNFKYWGKYAKQSFIAAIILGLLWILLGVWLYLLLNNTGLLLYLILMIKYHWFVEEES